jgi:hypothetical protein
VPLTGFMRGQNRQARETAEVFLREAEGRATEAGVARRVLGFVLLKFGDLQAARSVLERALGDYIRERDEETLFRFGNDTPLAASAPLRTDPVSRAPGGGEAVMSGCIWTSDNRGRRVIHR